MKKALRFIFGYLRTQKWRIALAMCLSFISSVLIVIRPRIQGKIIDDVAMPVWNIVNSGGTPGEDIYAHLASLILLIGAVTLMRSVAIYFFRMNAERSSQAILKNLRLDMYKKLNTLDFDFLDRNRTGDIMTKMTSDTDMIRHFSAYTIFILVENAVLFVGALGAMFYISPVLAVSFILILPFVMILSRKMSGNMRPCMHKVREAFSALNTLVQENISGNRVVKAFAREDYEIERFEAKNLGFAEANYGVADFQSKYIPILDFCGMSLNIILILVGGLLAVNGKISVGDIVTANGLLWAINNPLRMSGWLLSETERAVASCERIQEFMDAEPKITRELSADHEDVGRFFGEVEFKNVSFKYDDEYVLKDISFKAQPGQTIAIVGPTGSGKSTLINLINRFYDVSEGQILIDGADVRDIDLYKLRSNISTAMQDIFLFSDTIEGNIAYANPEASIEEIKRVSQAADADGFIQKLDDGYETVVGERGVGLSGGQKQRIALARALLADPSILILDDTTSAVDMETEHYIQETLKTYFSDRTTFIIAHRISAVKNADLILVLSDGQLLEYGKHENLIKRPREEAYYRSVFENQMGDFDSFYKKSNGGDM
ncbi:MAG: ABC transporter ATP-binding protein [Oscillospiraceae bacterium]|nr:ABC transporter ATP-binding protein [Oscillospiraceae bacterium]